MKTHHHIIFGLYLTLAGSLCGALPAVADSIVSPRNESEVRHSTVKLSDVFSGVPEDIDREIAQAPAPCKSVVYDVNVLTRLAQKYRLEWEPQGASDHVLISAACTRISGDTIRTAVIQKLKEEGIHGEIGVSFDNHALEVDLPADQSAYFSLNGFTYDPAGKRFSADMMLENTNGPYAFPIAGHITVKQNIPVLAHRLENGTVIAASDIDWLAVPEDRLNSSTITDAKSLIGHELRRDVNGDEIIHNNDVMPQRYVSRGSLVTLKIDTPYMTLTAQGKALQDGTAGDVVRVLNTQSNRTIEGIVDGPGIVRIQTSQKVAAAQ